LAELYLAIGVQTAGALQNQRGDLTSGECEGVASPLPDYGFAKAWHKEVQNGIRRRHSTLEQDVVVRATSFEWSSKAERAQE
jgi:hypothetical protein